MKLNPIVQARLRIALKSLAHFALIKTLGEPAAASVVKAAQLLSKIKNGQTKE